MKTDSPFMDRLAKKLDAAGFTRLTREDIRAIRGAFVEALKEEVLERYATGITPTNRHTSVVIAGLGSFRLKTRGNRSFIDPNDITGERYIPKPPATRIAFRSRWESIK